MPSKFLYKSYSFFYQVKEWRKTHFTPAGELVFWLLCISAVLGMSILKTNIYQFSACIAAIVFVSFLISILIPFRHKIEIRRILPEYAVTGDRLRYELEIVNPSSQVVSGIILHEDLCDPRPSFEELISSREPYETERNFWDRKTMYYRWNWLMRKNEKVFFEPLRLPELKAGGKIRVEASLTAFYRGYVNFKGFKLSRPDIFGFFNRVQHVKSGQKLLVLPEYHKAEPPEFVSRRHYNSGGLHFASSIGNSDEFVSLRPYRPGDPLKKVHWRSFAKTDELVIREFEDEYFVRYLLIMDTFLKQGDEIAFEKAVTAASSYVHAMGDSESILDLMFSGEKIHRFSTGRGLGSPEKMLEIIACIEPGLLKPDKQFESFFSMLKTEIHKFSGVISICLDWGEHQKKIYELFKQESIPVLNIVLTADKENMEEKVSRDEDQASRVNIVHIDELEVYLGSL